MKSIKNKDDEDKKAKDEKKVRPVEQLVNRVKTSANAKTCQEYREYLARHAAHVPSMQGPRWQKTGGTDAKGRPIVRDLHKSQAA